MDDRHLRDDVKSMPAEHWLFMISLQKQSLATRKTSWKSTFLLSDQNSRWNSSGKSELWAKFSCQCRTMILEYCRSVSCEFDACPLEF